MRNWILGAVMLAALVAFSASTPIEAQPAVAAPSHEELEKVARKFLAALPSEPDTVYAMLAKDMQGGVELHKARQAEKLGKDAKHWTRLKRKIEGAQGLDPWGRVPIKTSADYLALSNGVHCALHTGLYRLAGEQPKSVLAGRWFLVQRTVGMGYGPRREDVREGVLISVGKVQFENVPGDKISLTCSPEDGAWKIASFRVSLANFVASAELAPGSAADTEAATSEARAALGAMKDRGRVVYQRQVPKRVEMEDLGLGQGELDGRYYKESCYKVVSADVKCWGAMAVPQHEGDYPIVVIRANLRTGQSEFFEYEDMAAFEAANLFAATGKRTVQSVFGVYMKKGRTWTMKYESKSDNFNSVSYIKTEVKEFDEDHAVTVTTMFDENKKPYPGMEKGTESRIDFRMPEDDRPADRNVKESDGGTLEAAGRRWKTKKIEVSGEYPSVSWMSTEYPGLMVKFEMENKSMTTRAILDEFKD